MLKQDSQKPIQLEEKDETTDESFNLRKRSLHGFGVNEEPESISLVSFYNLKIIKATFKTFFNDIRPTKKFFKMKILMSKMRKSPHW